MIARITGEIVEKSTGSVVLQTGGIGYRVYVLPSSVERMVAGKSASLFTHLVVRENLLDLYGFLTEEELRIFELLISVSGIGPKGAMGVLAQANPREIKTAIQLRDYSVLTKVSGIGKKTAERIVLELKNKVGELAEGGGAETNITSDGEAIEALMALGYKREEAKKSLSKIDSGVDDVGEKVRQALRILAGRK